MIFCDADDLEWLWSKSLDEMTLVEMQLATAVLQWQREMRVAQAEEVCD